MVEREQSNDSIAIGPVSDLLTHWAVMLWHDVRTPYVEAENQHYLESVPWMALRGLSGHPRMRRNSEWRHCSM
jgi:hypothetical protein